MSPAECGAVAGRLPASSAVLVVAVGFNAILSLAHGLTHVAIPVPVAEWQATLATVLLFVAPLIGVGLVQYGRIRLGVWLVFGGGVAAFAFEGASHFLLDGPDNVHAVSHGHDAFAGTAALTTAGDAALVIGAWLCRGYSHGGSSRSAIEESR